MEIDDQDCKAGRDYIDLCSKAASKQGAEKFEIYWERSSSQGVEIRDGKLDHFNQSLDQGISIRVLKNQRMGFAYSFDLSKPALERMVKTAIEISEVMPTDRLLDLQSLANQPYAEVVHYDSKGLEVSLEEKIDMARKMESDILKSDKRIQKVQQAGIDQVAYDAILRDSNGDQVQHRQTVFSAGALCVTEENGAGETGYDAHHACFYDQLNFDQVVKGTVKVGLELLGAKPMKTGIVPAVFRNNVVAELLSFLADSFSAENIDKNFSLLVGKKGEKLFSDEISIYDDGLYPNGVASRPFDGEGTASQKITLVDSGSIAAFFYDNYYAKKHETKSTASSRRGGLKSAPSIGASNIFMKAGRDTTLEKLCATAGTGLLVTDLMGLHTANPVTGEFSVGASGILIENGKMTTPVKGFAVSGTIVDLLRKTTHIGSDLRFWGGTGAPSMLVSELTVSGT